MELLIVSAIASLDLNAVFYCCKAVVPLMVEQNYGRIVNIASDAARVGSSGEAVYAACKGGLVALSKTLAREHARHGITVNVVCPGPTDTALFAGFKDGAANPDKLVQAFERAIPLGRIGQPDDLAGFWSGAMRGNDGAFHRVEVAWMRDGDPFDPLPGWFGR